MIMDTVDRNHGKATEKNLPHSRRHFSRNPNLWLFFFFFLSRAHKHSEIPCFSNSIPSRSHADHLPSLDTPFVRQLVRLQLSQVILIIYVV